MYGADVMQQAATNEPFTLSRPGASDAATHRYARAAWGRGLATEAAAVALDHGFRALELDPIVAVGDPGNAASHRVLRKIGLRAAGTARHYGLELPIFELSRDEYLARTQSSPSTSPME